MKTQALKTKFLTNSFLNLQKELLDEIKEYSIIKKISAKEYAINQNQLLYYLPVLVEGIVKVYCVQEGTSFLLYYVSSEAIIINPSFKRDLGFYSVAEVNSTIMFLPLQRTEEWANKYPDFLKILLSNYRQTKDMLFNNLTQSVFLSLEDRLLIHLKRKAEVMNTKILKVSHREIAYDLKTSRETISRLISKLISNKKIIKNNKQEIVV